MLRPGGSIPSQYEITEGECEQRTFPGKDEFGDDIFPHLQNPDGPVRTVSKDDTNRVA